MGELGRRVVEPGIDDENIPPCDLILISHSHMDHLSLGSLQILEKRSKKASLIFAEDIEEFLPDFDFELVKMKNADGYLKEYIGETKIINDIKVTSVFAQHWGGRYGIDGYLWGNLGFTGYVIEYKDLTVYFAGDTGYDSTAFKKMGSVFEIDLSLIPIGPCAECEGNGTKHHVFPPESIMVFKDLKAGKMIPIHYATFQFAQAPPETPLHTFKRLVKENGLDDKVIILEIGAQKIFSLR
jgi:L-ascorbate metabolism protein UlaG (beta-lactamase superfamily)